MDAFPVMSIGAGALGAVEAAGERVKSAGRKVRDFVGDARMALAAGEYETEAGVLDKRRPLPAVTVSGPSVARSPGPASAVAGVAQPPDPWGPDPKKPEPQAAAGGTDPWGQDEEEEGEGPKQSQSGYAAALDRFLAADEGGGDYEAALSAVLERERELLAEVEGDATAEQEDALSLTRDQRRRIQACLKAQEFDPGVVDGIFGPRTRTAIQAWQAANGRAESGYLTREGSRSLLAPDGPCEVVVAEAETTETEMERAKEEPEAVVAHIDPIPKCSDVDWGKAEELYKKWRQDTPWGINMIFPCWVEIENRPGCFITPMNWPQSTVQFFPPARSQASVHWSGECRDGVPDGEGIFSMVIDNNKKKWLSGDFVGGKRNGLWKALNTNGDTIRVTFLNGKVTEMYRGWDNYAGSGPHIWKMRDRDVECEANFCSPTYGYLCGGVEFWKKWQEKFLKVYKYGLTPISESDWFLADLVADDALCTRVR